VTGFSAPTRWQVRGLGTALMRRLADTAAEQGLVELTGMARPDDLGVTRVLRRAAFARRRRPPTGWCASGPPSR
jgi:hypothetical protein